MGYNKSVREYNLGIFLDLPAKDQFGMVLSELSRWPERQVSGIAKFGEAALTNMSDTKVVADAFLNIRDWRKCTGLDRAMWYATGVVLGTDSSRFHPRYVGHWEDLAFLYFTLANQEVPGDVHLARGFVSLLAHIHVQGTESPVLRVNYLEKTRREADESLVAPLLKVKFIQWYCEILQKIPES